MDRLSLLLDCLDRLRQLDLPEERQRAVEDCLSELIPHREGPHVLEAGRLTLRRENPFDETDRQLLTLLAEQLETLEQRAHVGRLATLGQLTSALVHELNTPLSAVNLALEGALARPDRAEPRLQRAILSVQQIRQMVTRVLRHARDDRSPRTMVDLNQAVREALELVGHQLMMDRVEVRTRLEASLPLHAQALEIQQILTNLLLNARDAVLEQGERQIEVRAFDSGLEVRDRGCGMSPETRARIFQPFFSTKGVGKGTGLGLAVVADLVMRHQGRIEVESAPGAGTTVRVVFA